MELKNALVNQPRWVVDERAEKITEKNEKQEHVEKYVKAIKNVVRGVKDVEHIKKNRFILKKYFKFFKIN